MREWRSSEPLELVKKLSRGNMRGMFSASLPRRAGLGLYLLLLLADHRVLLFRQLEKSLRRINQGGPRRPMREGARNV